MVNKPFMGVKYYKVDVKICFNSIFPSSEPYSILLVLSNAISF